MKRARVLKETAIDHNRLLRVCGQWGVSRKELVAWAVNDWLDYLDEKSPRFESEFGVMLRQAALREPAEGVPS